MIYVCFFDNSKLNLRRIKKTILFLIHYLQTDFFRFTN